MICRTISSFCLALSMMAALTLPLPGQVVGQVAVQVGAQQSRAVPSPRVTPQDVYDEHQLVFESLFSSAFDPEAPSYSLTEDVLGIGTYGGFNQFGEAFTLDVVSGIELDPNSPEANLNAAELQLVSQYSLVHHSVVGYLQTGLGLQTVWGMTVSATVNNVEYSSFLLGGIFDEDPANVDFNNILGLTQDDGDGDLTLICIQIPKYCVDPDCADDCYDAYNDAIDAADQAVDEATEEYGDGMDEAESDMEYQEDLMLAANITLGVALAQATYTYYKGQMACGAVSLVTGPLTGLGCLAANAAVALGKTIAATATYDLARRGIEDAMEDIQDRIDQLQADYDQALQDWADAREAAEEALDDCLDGCPKYLCGYYVLCFWIYTPGRGEGYGERYWDW